MRKGYRATIPPVDTHPGLELTWQENCQSSVDCAVACADRWLASDRSTHLWLPLMVGRERQDSAARQMAFEVAFLTRLQQRLGSAPPPRQALERLADAANTV
ncbi:MAG: LasR-specific antiactivator QslA [Pseudomonadota bacterium]